MNYTEPKLVFRTTDNPLVLEYAMDHGRGQFTPTGLRTHHVEPIAKWCFENSCGVLHSYPYHIVFKDESEVAWFLLRWT